MGGFGESLEFSSVLPVWQIVLLSAVSFLVGILGGFVGLALGTMRLPALLLIGVSAPTAAGTNILVSTLSALVGGYRHIRERRVNWSVVALRGSPSLVGSLVGGFASSSSVPDGALVMAAGAFVSWQAVELLMRLRRAPTSQAYAGPLLTPKRGVVEGIIGLVVGLVGGSVGLILGSVRLPLMIRVLHLDPRTAAGSNLVIGFLMGSFGFEGHGIQGEVDVPLLAAMGLAGMVGTYLGARLTGRVSLDSLMLAMSAVLFLVGILLIRDGAVRWL